MKNEIVIIKRSDVRLVFLIGVLVGMVLLISVAIGYVWFAPNHVSYQNKGRTYSYGIPY